MRATIALCLFVLGCLGPVVRVAPGTYSDPSGEEWITIREHGAVLHVQVPDGASQRLLHREFDDHHVSRNGALALPREVNQPDPLGRHMFWWWDGTRITRVNGKTGETTDFERRDP